MLEPIIESVDLTVLNGPTEISLDVDFGRPGVRGSQIYVVAGDPNVESQAIPESIRYNDLVINNSTATPQDYLNVYQYINSGGVDVWEKVFRITTNFYSNTSSKVFTNGEAVINIPARSIVGSELAASASSDDFNVQCTIAGSENLVSSSVSVGSINPNDEDFNLPITIKAAEFDGSTWSLVDGLLTVHLFITVV